MPLKQARSDPWVRELCRQNTCRQYGASWACPPAVGTLEECQARAQSYDAMLLFSRRYTLCDSFDFESMTAGQAAVLLFAHKKGGMEKIHTAFFYLLNPFLPPPGAHKEGKGFCHHRPGEEE